MNRSQTHVYAKTRGSAPPVKWSEWFPLLLRWWSMANSREFTSKMLSLCLSCSKFVFNMQALVEWVVSAIRPKWMYWKRSGWRGDCHRTTQWQIVENECYHDTCSGCGWFSTMHYGEKTMHLSFVGAHGHQSIRIGIFQCLIRIVRMTLVLSRDYVKCRMSRTLLSCLLTTH